MKQFVRRITVAAIAATALSVIAAQAAWGEQDAFRTHTAEPVELTAEALEVQGLILDEGTDFVKCSFVEVRNATVEDNDTAVTVEPIYNNEENTCEGALGKSRVTTNGCHYLLTGATDETGDADVHLQCPEGVAGIRVDGPLDCTITFPPQTVTGVHYASIGSTPTEDLRVDQTITGIDYDITPICEFGGIHDKDDGVLTGSITVTGWEDDGSGGGHGQGQVGIRVETSE